MGKVKKPSNYEYFLKADEAFKIAKKKHSKTKISLAKVPQQEILGGLGFN